MQKLRTFLIPAFLITLAITIQTQLTFFKSEDYSGLRLNLADLLLPFTGLTILISLLCKNSIWPKWSIRHFYIWLAALTSMLGLAFLNTHFLYGEWSHWALINKLTGWAVLMGYLGLGGWLTTNLHPQKIELFLKTMMIFFIVVLLIQSIGMATQNLTDIRFRQWIWYPIEGLMANRNSFSFFILSAVSIGIVFFMKKQNTFHRYLIYFLGFILPAGLLFNGSRAGIIAMGILMICITITFRKEPWIRILLAFLLGIICIFALYGENAKKLQFLRVKNFDAAQHITDIIKVDELEKVENKIGHIGDQNRLKVIKDSIEMLKERPVLGSGLGSALIYQKEKRGQAIDIIDNTPLWLWVETGLIGLFVFVAFYITCLKTLWRQAKGDDLHAAFSQSLFFILIGFAVMSLFHELMYSRFLWLLLGMALVHRNQSSAPQTNPAKA